MNLPSHVRFTTVLVSLCVRETWRKNQTLTLQSIQRVVSVQERIHITVTYYAFSLIQSLPSPESTTAIKYIDTGNRISYFELVRRPKNLAAYLQIKIGGDTALILSPNSIETLILYFSLLSLGVIISPSNPENTKPEIPREIDICKLAIAFAIKTTSFKIPLLRHSTILLDSSDYQSMMTGSIFEKRINVHQSDPATIMCSSRTTGKVKGRSVAVMERFNLRMMMMNAIGKCRVAHLVVASPVVVSRVKNDGVMDGHDFRSLQPVASGGAAFPAVQSLCQK
ncbi:AMP-dependent synthetase/ligase [Dillenia turbinata]|uniref:AMP-dependent synthetase/ligase n=1 Tax=Dillenia turbinata TaxID=194707 RepID=A0AAN8Z4I3_9MAGN